jgi:hypothetical protein
LVYKKIYKCSFSENQTMTEEYKKNKQRPCHGCGSTDYEESYVVNGTGEYCGKCPAYHKLKASELEKHFGNSIPQDSFFNGYF